MLHQRALGGGVYNPGTMMTLRCTRKLLERLRVPPDTESDAGPDNALGDWYANLVRVGHDQLVVAVNERSFLTLVLPARGVRDSIAGELPRLLGTLLRELEVPDAVAAREAEAMQPMAFARTADRSMVASLNERVRLVQHFWAAGVAPMDIILRLARAPIMAGPAAADLYPSRAARRILGLDREAPPPATVVRLHVSLEGLSPMIWRRLVVPETITLPQLHRVLQVAMGWNDCHLHAFELAGVRYGEPDEDGLDDQLRDESGIRLGDLIRDTHVDHFVYTYDFGDDWRHVVRVEAVEPNTGAVRGAVCLDGANRCPPEDVGGPPGYLELIQALRDPRHPAHREMVEWIGEASFDPTAFDLTLRNALLRCELP